MGKPQENHIKAARAVWEVMQKEASSRGMALSKNKQFGDGRVIIGAVKTFIKVLNDERGWRFNDTDFDLVRSYLKSTGNVVVLSKVEKYRYRIFIREEWNETPLVKGSPKEPDSIDRRAEKLTADEAGETREPAPVEFKCVRCVPPSVWGSQPALNAHMALHKNDQKKETPKPKIYAVSLGESQAAILTVLLKNGGIVSHVKGATTQKIARQDPRLRGKTNQSLGSTMIKLENDGLITRDVRKKRTYRVELTEYGKEVAADINSYRAATQVILDYLKENPVTEWNTATMKDDLGASAGVVPDRVRRALTTLEHEGEITRGQASMKKTRIVLAGAEGQVAEPVKDAESLPAPSGLFEELDDAVLLTILERRLNRKEEVASYKEKVEFIDSIVSEANDGKISPLKALADIQEALKL